jgi:hypothetical protein
MSVDASRLDHLVTVLHPGKLSAADAETIVAISQLAVDADGSEDTAEIRMFFTLGKAVFKHAGLTDTPTPTFAVDEDDDERLRSLAGQLSDSDARELAYAVAHVLTIIDIGARRGARAAGGRCDHAAEVVTARRRRA